jgi:septum formation protein
MFTMEKKGISSTEPLILASSSSRRKDLLELLGVPFQVVPSRVLEETVRASGPQELSIKAAVLKARQVAGRYPSRWVLAADTVVWLDGTALGKPAGEEDARRMLKMLQARVHEVVTGLCVLRLDKGLERRCAVSTLVQMRELSPPEVDWYVSTGEPMDKAGAYAIQGLGGIFVTRIQGSYTNVVGLPLPELVLILREVGAWDFLSHCEA